MTALTKPHLTTQLSTYSPKFKQILANVDKSPGTVLIYSQFNSVEGIEILSRCLHTYSEFVIEYKNGEWNIYYDENKPSYIRFKPKDNLDDKKKIEYSNIILAIFNNEFEKLPTNIRNKLKNKSNLRGELIKILFITQSGAEGISLKNVRQVHITEPYWNKNRMDQVIGRANRTCSHIALPKSERNFTVFTYTMQFTETQKQNKLNRMIISRNDKNMTTDQTIYNIANNKHKIITEFLDCMKKASVDCALNNPQLGCFSFPVDVSNSKKAYTVDIYKNARYRNTVEVKKTALKLHINSLNKTFIYIKDTGELFDYTLYISTSVLKLVGYLKKIENDDKYSLNLI